MKILLKAGIAMLFLLGLPIVALGPGTLMVQNR